MDQCRPRHRRPDKALCVPKARQPPADDGNVSSENSTDSIEFSPNKTPNRSRYRNHKGSWESLGREYRAHQDRTSYKSSVLKKQSERRDQGTDLVTTEQVENDSLCETFINLSINERLTTSESDERHLSASRNDSTDAIHHSSSSTESFPSWATAAKHHQEKKCSYRRSSCDTWAEQDRYRKKDQAKGKSQFSKSESYVDALKRKQGMFQLCLEKLSSSTENLKEAVTIVCNQSNLGLPSNTIDNSWGCKVENIDSTTVHQSGGLFSAADSAEVISVSDTIKDPSGLLTVLESSADNTGNALLYERQENITERKLDPSPVIAEHVLQEDNRAIVLAIEPCRGADYKACPCEGARAGLDSMHARVSPMNVNTAQGVSETDRELEGETVDVLQDWRGQEDNRAIVLAIEPCRGADYKACPYEGARAGLDSMHARVSPMNVNTAQGVSETDRELEGETVDVGHYLGSARLEGRCSSANVIIQGSEEVRTMRGQDTEMPHGLVTVDVMVMAENASALVNAAPNDTGAVGMEVIDPAFTSHEVVEELPSLDGVDSVSGGVNAEPPEAPSKQAEPCPKVDPLEPILCPNTGMVCSDDLNQPNLLTDTDFVLGGYPDPVSDSCVASLETTDKVTPCVANVTEEESWDSLFNDDGECVDPHHMKELSLSDGDHDSPKKSRYNYYDYEPREPDIDDLQLSHVIEIYGFPAEFKTEDLLRAFASYQKKGFDIKWVDDTHTLGVFASPFAARDALSNKNPSGSFWAGQNLQVAT
ncbi:uncharacterized protein LOC142259431 [Anomaloglossus baeobatrachus]|uniref:uncharacterized protein LOC142259431 n=1 Tax=Anomaloglossus baeobatrachus TaxID=238106 RepID=UPI003F505928